MGFIGHFCHLLTVECNADQTRMPAFLPETRNRAVVVASTIADAVALGIEGRQRHKQQIRIENGRLGAPVKGASLIGNGPDVMQRVSRIGSDLELDHGVGTCGKDGQSVPVGVGMPTIRIDGITVGGTRG